MGDFNAEVICAELKGNVKSNQHRIDKLETQQDVIQKILISIETIAVEMKGMKETQEEMKRNQEKSQEEVRYNQALLEKQIRDVEKVPDKKAASYVDRAITALISAVVAYLITNFKK